MAKAKKSKKLKKTTRQSKSTGGTFLNFKPWQTILLCIGIIIIATMILLSDLAFKGMVPAGSDVLASKGKTNLMQQYKEQTGEKPLWNPAIFSGMPQYHRYGPQSWSLDILASYFYDDYGGQVLIYYIIGTIGMFVLLYSLNFSPIIALFGALAFLLMPHYNSLWLAGHFSKFRAIMYMPWALAAFFNFLNKKNILGMFLFALAFSLQLRTQHYQIIFYTALLMFAIGIYPVIKLLIDKKFADFVRLFGLLILAAVLTIASVYQPFFPMKEYTPYSTRGGNAVHIEKIDDSAQRAKGVSFDYATKWSLSPKEMITFLIPRYFGGSSQEQYRGKDVPQLQGRSIPGYWGDMPFTSSTDYIGLTLFILLIFGIYGFRHDWRIVSLGIFTVFALLLGFGRHFPVFYKIFFYYLPYFSKFRVPTMIMMAIFVVFIIFAAFGFRYLLNVHKKEDKNAQTVLYAIAGFLFLLSVSPFLLKGALSFATPREIGVYTPQVLQLLKSARFELMKMDALRTLLISAIAIGLIFVYLKKYIPAGFFTIGLFVIMLIDVPLVNYRFFDALQKESDFEARLSAKSNIDNYLLTKNEQDPEPFRVLGLGQFFGNNNLAYYHQCIGGYDAAKPQLIQDIIDNNLYQGWNSKLPINWHVVNFLNGKYIIVDGTLEHDNLKFIMQNNRKQLLYENTAVLPRAFLVGAYQQINDPVEILKTINKPNFDPHKLALLETELPGQIEQPDSISFAKVTKFTPNKIDVQATTNKQCLLVLSETYYPIGWDAFINGEKTEIYKTNHILRSILLPAGAHNIEFTFHPESYFKGKLIATIANLIVLLSIIGLLTYSYIKKNR